MANILRIMITTDNHLVSCVADLEEPCLSRARKRSPSTQGVWEKDEIRKNDSFEAFEEIMQKAAEYQVDIVLLGRIRAAIGGHFAAALFTVRTCR